MTRECDILQELISAYADGECSAGEAIAVEAHLKDCALCRKELERLQANAAWVACSAEPFPKELHERIMERVNAQKVPNKRRWILPTRVLAGAVAACAVFGLAIGLYLKLGDHDAPFLRHLRADSAAVGLAVSDQAMLSATQLYRMQEQGAGEWRGEPMREATNPVSCLILSGEHAIWIDEIGMERKGSVSYDNGHPVRLLFGDAVYVIDYDGADGITVRAED